MDTCGIILASVIGGACALGFSLACCCEFNQRRSYAQRRVGPNPDCIVITKEHYENLKRLGPPEYTDQAADPIGDPPVYDDPPPSLL